MAGCSAKFTVNQDLLEQFCAVTGGSKDAGQHLLEACNGDLQMAIGMHMDGAGQGGSATMEGDGSVPLSGGATAGNVPEDGDFVRAPIPQRREVLVDHNAYIPTSRRRATRSVFDSFRDFEAETRQAERMRRGETGLTQKRKTLGDLFKPPLELIHKGSFHSAKEEGVAANKWLLVNVQNVQEFSCQVLNRDVWSNFVVRELVKKHFVFWQVYSDSEEGKRYMQFYNIHKWPYMAILDPQTGEKFNEWDSIDLKSVLEILRTFLSEHPKPDTCNNSDSPPCKKSRKENSIVDASEESQIEAAIRASLKESSISSAVTVSSESDQSENSELETFSDSGSEKHKAAKKETLQSDSDSEVVGKSRKRKLKSKGKSSRGAVKNGKCKHNVHVIEETSQSSSVLSTESINKSSETSSISSAIPQSSTTGCSEMSPSPSSREGASLQEVPEECWQDYLGSAGDDKTRLLLRYPDGTRHSLTIPCSSQLRAVILYISAKQIDLETHELVTNFPRRNLSILDSKQTLKEAGLHPQETIYVQFKS